MLHTRGIGRYPGAAEENFDPLLVLDPAAPYGNLALHRPAFGSSAYDYNLTAQLVTDGIRDTTMPTWITTLINGEIQPKESRELLLNHFRADPVELPGDHPSVEVHLGGGTSVPEVDRIVPFLVLPQSVAPADVRVTVSCSADGHLWQQVGHGDGGTPVDPTNYPPDLARGAHLLAPSIALANCAGRFFRFEFQSAPANPTAADDGGILFRLTEVEFYQGKVRVEVGGPYHFTSAWKPASMADEWVYVDLGARFRFDKVVLHWIARAAEGLLQVSDDAATWSTVQALPIGETGSVDTLSLATPVSARYVRLLLTRPASAQGYVLSEFEIYGHGGFLVQPRPRPASQPDGALRLCGGSWMLRRAQADDSSGEALSTPGFADDRNWIVATVPGTELTSFQNAGAIPDPNYGSNQLQLSDSFFYSDFWYRTEFSSPPPGEVAALGFAGVDWKADVYLNGEKLGRIDGGFTRGSFDVTGKLRPRNALAVRVLRNATPGSAKQKTYATTGRNGGALGTDNPTFHASIGWDWIPTVRGRNTGIWGEVTLTTSGAVTLHDPLVTTTLPLPEITSATVAVEVFVRNNSARPVHGTVSCRFGAQTVRQAVRLAANEERVVRLKPLQLADPQLWWPAGYGEAHLYDVELQFEATGHQHDTLRFKAAVRQFTADEQGGNLHLFINGRRLIVKGGNWGFSEVQLRFRAREYDACVRYHREQHFNTIRNWVGQVPDDAFFEACDRHGIVIWQDFWLANPWDGPVPDDNTLFLANARDFLRRIRRHGSIGLYCGRNEWFPPAALDTGLRALLAELHPGIHYIGSSADGPVSGHGPYRALPVPFYFQNADPKLHSELGAPCIPTADSVQLMMPRTAQWPQGLDWGLHDFTLQGAQGGTTFLSLIQEAYGGADSMETWTELAQFINYDTYRAMFEAQSKYRMGLLLWMSHSCWPSFVWQTYDYYLEPTAAYFGCKKACEPLHIQWNSFAETVEVVNGSGGRRTGLTALVELLNLDGNVVAQKSAVTDSAEDSTVTVMPMTYPAGLSETHFVRLTLTEAGKAVSTNFYLRGLQENDFRAIRTLGNAAVKASTTTSQHDGICRLTTELENTSAATPALLVRLKAVRGTTGDRILPVLYEDNFFALMPGEHRTLTTELRLADARGETPRMMLEGFNLKGQ